MSCSSFGLTVLKVLPFLPRKISSLNRGNLTPRGSRVRHWRRLEGHGQHHENPSPLGPLRNSSRVERSFDPVPCPEASRFVEVLGSRRTDTGDEDVGPGRSLVLTRPRTGGPHLSPTVCRPLRVYTSNTKTRYHFCSSSALPQ